MKKHIGKTVSILSLFVMLSVCASNVSAGGGCSTCNPRAQYVVSASAQDTTAAVARPAGDDSFIALFWTRLAVFFAPLW